MIERPDADALMAGSLGQWLAGQDASRAEAKAKSARYTRNGIIAGIVLGIAALALFRDFEAGMAAGFGSFGIGSWMAHNARKQVTDKLKSAINQAIAESLGFAYTMAAPARDCYERACSFRLLPSHDNETLEDEWSGTLGDQPFRLHEAKLTEERGSGKSRRTVTVFEGTLMTIAFARRFHGITLVERDGKHRSLFGFQKDSIELDGVELGHIPMVDPRFEDAFNVWSNDPVEAQYLVHPEYIERLIAVEQAYAGENIRALFHGGELLVVLESGNLFDSGSLQASDDRMLLERTIGQFDALAQLATKLNERPR